MNTLDIEGRQVELQVNGHLKQLADWSPDVAEALARKDGLKLSKAHWEVINAMREYYERFMVSPVRKLLKRDLQRRFGNSAGSDLFLDSLFPGDVVVQGAKIAGVPVPHLDADRVSAPETSGSVPRQSTGSSFEFDGKTIKLSHTGNMVELHMWNEGLAEELAKRESIGLTSEHWEVLTFLRKFYFEYGISPMVQLLMKHISEELGMEKGTKAYLYRLFPGGPSRQGSRIAGLPEPQGCIDP